MTVSSLSLDDALKMEAQAWRTPLSAASAWDLTLTPQEQATLARERTRRASSAWACVDGQGKLSAAWVQHSSWDSEFFGIKMGVLGLEGRLCAAALSALLERVDKHASEEGYAHLRCAQRAGAPEALNALQRHGFHFRWASLQIVCDTRTISSVAPRRPAGLTFELAQPEHLEALQEAARSIGPYNWPEFDPELPKAGRERYVPTRIRNCVLSDYADHTLVALWRGRPVGFHASAITQHAPGLPVGQPFAYVKETFVSPSAPANLGAHLIRNALFELRPHTQHVTGRVRLDGRSMLNTSLSAGYTTIAGDEVLMSRAY